MAWTPALFFFVYKNKYEMKNKQKTMWVFLFKKYGTFWSVSLRCKVENKLSISEEWLEIGVFSVLSIEKGCCRSGTSTIYYVNESLNGIAKPLRLKIR